jgi:hypothetical protein
MTVATMNPRQIAEFAAQRVVDQPWNTALTQTPSGEPQDGILSRNGQASSGAPASIFQNKFYWLGIGALAGFVGLYILSPKGGAARPMAGLRGMHPMGRMAMMRRMKSPSNRRRSGNVTRRRRRRR